MQVSNSSFARPWKLEQNTSGQASRQASRHASRASRLWKLEQNNMKEGRLFWSSKRNKNAGAQKWVSPVCNFALHIGPTTLHTKGA